MTPTAHTLDRFYAAFARLDTETMAACYADNAVFDDEAFSLRGKREVMGMWRMLCDAVREKGQADWKLEWRDISGDEYGGQAHWEAWYRFSATGRLVHNRIDARFGFDNDGLIAVHCDRFDFHAWAGQALGMPGRLLGWTPWLRTKVRTQAMANLQRYLAKHP